jgi:hypothetical protein
MKKAMNMVHVYRATAVAHGSVCSIAPMPTVKEIIQASREEMALEECMLSCEVTFFETVDKMNLNEKVDLVFGFFDTRNRNQVGEKELEVGLSKLRSFTSNKAEYPAAAMLVEIFASRRGGDLTRDDFESLIDGLAASSIDCTFKDTCQLLLKSMLFMETSLSVMEATVASISGQARCNAKEVIEEARLVLLFNALDESQSGHVLLQDLVKALFRLTENMWHLERQSLLLLQAPKLRKLDYELFTEVILNVSEYFSERTIDAVGNEITLALATQDIDDDEINHLFVSGNPFNDSASTMGSIDSIDSGDNSQILDRSMADSFASFGAFRMPISWTWLESAETKGLMHANK